jgi:signal transduction histidine kinase
LPSTASGAAPFVSEASRWLSTPSIGESQFDAFATTTEVDEAARPTPSAEARAPACILIADDNADMRAYLARLLGQRWTVEVVADGRRGWERARASVPDLLIADVMMPGLDGFELLRAIRADEQLRAMPVLLLSARAGEESRVEGLEAGADDYLVKPFAARELLARVQAHLEFARLRKEADLERSRLRALFMEAPAPICILRGPEHRYEFVNPSYARLVGDRPLLGRTVREALPEIAGQGFYELLDGVYQTGRPYYGTEMPARLSPSARESDEFFFNFVYQPMRTVLGVVEGIVVFAYDVTDQVLARRSVEASIRSRDAFFSAASHELRNPIQALQLQLLGILRRVDAEPEQLDPVWVRTRVDKATQQVARLVRLLNNLLDASRIAAGRLHLELEDVDFCSVLTDAVERLEPEARRLVNLHVAGEVHGWWDRMRLDQVVTNLLSNALKYGAQHPIDLVLASDAECAILQVRDRGIGIAAADQTKIFEQFERADRNRHYEGFGLGLWISQQIARALGGTITLESEPERGSTFTVRLPLRPPMPSAPDS